ncbi:MAG: hypothetical protein WB799_08770 [Candidatus Sulfotelmatobacter sp.]
MAANTQRHSKTLSRWCQNVSARMQSCIASSLLDSKRFLRKLQVANVSIPFTIPLDGPRLDELFAMIARGLIWCHWQVYLEKNYAVQTHSVTRFGERFFDECLFKLNARNRVRRNLGDGAFTYEGAQAVDHSGITIWRFDIYGGLVSCEDPTAPETMGSQIVVITAPEAAFQAKAE